MIDVTVLLVGYAKCSADGGYRADGTVTLIRQYPDPPTTKTTSILSDGLPHDHSAPAAPPAPIFTILVDTGSPFDGPALSSALSGLGIDLRKRTADDLNSDVICSGVDAVGPSIDAVGPGVDAVVCTHGHVDHVGNLNLFAESRQTVFYLGGDKLIPEDVYETIEFEPVDEIRAASTSKLYGNFLTGRQDHEDECIFLVKTPGHTESDLSLVIMGDEIRVSCLKCRLDDFEDPTPSGSCQTCRGFGGFGGRGCVVIAGDLFEDENDDADDGVAWKENAWDAERQAESRDAIRRIADVVVPGHGRPFRPGLAKELIVEN